MRAHLHTTGRLAQGRVRAVLGPPRDLSRTWGFRIFALAFLAEDTKAVAVYMHGLVGMSMLLVTAGLVAGLERSLPAVIGRIRRGAARNRAAILLSIWYVGGVLGTMYFAGSTNTDWRQGASSALILVGFLVGFAYLSESRAARLFQIAYVLMVGINCLATSLETFRGGLVIREMVVSTNYLWLYGDQGFFAINAVLLPMLIWRSVMERGVLRAVLLACCAVTGYVAVTSSYGTPAGALLVGLPAFAALGLFFGKTTSYGARLLVVSLILYAGVMVVVRVVDAPVLEPVRSRVTNAWKDPRSGGYDPRQAEYGSRWMLAEISWDSFVDSPLLGRGRGGMANSGVVGGHSSLFDLLGFYGILGGGGAFLGLLFTMSRRAQERLTRVGDWESICAMTSLVMFLLVGVVNPYWGGLETATVLLIGRLFRMPPAHA